MAIDYAAKKLGEVVVAAMRSEQPLHLRLTGCICDLGPLSHHDHLPPDLKERLDAIITACTREPDPTGGSLGTATATALKMDWQEVQQWLDKIQCLYEDVIAREQREKIAREILAVRP